MPLQPDFDAFHEPDDRAGLVLGSDHGAMFAGTVDAVQAGQPFVGALFRVEDDDDPTWLAGYTADAPGTLADVAGEFGAGTYQVRTLAGYPHASARRLDVTIGARRSRRPAGGSQAAPTLAPDELERLRESIRRELREDVQREAAREDSEAVRALSKAADDLRRAEAKVADADDRIARLTRDMASLSADADRYRATAASAQEAAAVARQELADAQLGYAQELAATERKHLNELARLKDAVATLSADARVTAMELTIAQRGEGGLTAMDRMVGVIEQAAGPLMAAIADRMAQGDDGGGDYDADQRVGGDYGSDYDVSDGPLYPPPPAMPAHFPPAHAGDGATGEAHHLAGPDARSAEEGTEGALRPVPAARPVPADPDRPGHPDDAPGDAPHAAAVAVTPAHLRDFALAAVEGVPGAPTAAEFARLVAAVVGAGADDWRALGTHVLTRAIETAAPPERVADYLLPIVAPFGAYLTPLLALPGASATTTAAKMLGLSVGKSERGYLTGVLGALRPRLAGAAASAEVAA